MSPTKKPGKILEVHPLSVGPFLSNCYLVKNSQTSEAIIFDPGDDADLIQEMTRRENASVKAIWNTHGHLDHIMANASMHERTGAPISIHQTEKDWLESADLCGASRFGLPFKPSKADTLWEGGEEIPLIGVSWKIYHTPGHSPGSCVIVCEEENFAIGGDLIFRQSIGRTDLPGANPREMENSLLALATKWGKTEWTIFPGHGPETTLAQELRDNPFLVHLMGGGSLP